MAPDDSCVTGSYIHFPPENVRIRESCYRPRFIAELAQFVSERENSPRDLSRRGSSGRGPVNFNRRLMYIHLYNLKSTTTDLKNRISCDTIFKGRQKFVHPSHDPPGCPRPLCGDEDMASQFTLAGCCDSRNRVLLLQLRYRYLLHFFPVSLG